MKSLLEKYKEYLKYELNYSDNTINSYLINLEKYNEYLENNKIDYLNITKDEIIEYLKYLDSLKLSNKSICNILSSIRSFYNYLLDDGLIEVNIFKIIKNPKIPKNLPNFLSYEEMRIILDSITLKDILSYRNKLIIELLYATGIRVSELINIKINDITYENNSIRIFGKGRKERIVYFGEYAKKALDDYLSVRKSESEYLILNKDGKNITSRGVEKIINKICDEACLKNHVSPHTFRHTFATHLLNNGADIKSVQELLGHNSLNTTEVYTHITNDYLKSVYLKSMPRK